ncbi:MAG: penicillin-binding protein 2 [Holosporales bacterium]|jgi:cell division protein FtsI (penicillin-binding protein 3)|nr:penicillin-binding protein 2 [Holosporales bacterium]
MMKTFKGFSLWRKIKEHPVLMEALQIRAVFSCVFGVVVFGAISYRLLDVMVIKNIPSQSRSAEESSETIATLREDITDRNGEVLATCIATASCYADPAVVINIQETAQKLSLVEGMPDIEKISQKIYDKNKRFVWLARHIPPKTQQKIMDLGLPGICFRKDYKRIYPYGNLFSHTVGGTDIDGNGMYGIERKFDDVLKSKKITLSLDVRVQGIVYDELKNAVEKFGAIGGNAMVMSTSGEIISIVSLPDFDPNYLRDDDINSMFNRNTLGTYEPGSTFKILNTAIALETGIANLGSQFDATAPIKIGKFSITDFRGKNRSLSLAEAFVFSSNIAAIKISQQFGIEAQQKYMKSFGILDKCNLELPEVGMPIVPKNWSLPMSMTLSYGYGISVTPLQLLSSVTSVVGGKGKTCPTLLLEKRHKQEIVVSQKTSEIMRDLMRATICFGTARKAGVKGIEIFGKTGTAYKKVGIRGYGSGINRSRITTFIGGFSRKDPKYMLVVMLDDPKPTKETFGYATAGWNAAPTAGKIFERIVPILGDGNDILDEEDSDKNLIVTKYLKLN